MQTSPQQHLHTTPCCPRGWRGVKGTAAVTSRHHPSISQIPPTLTPREAPGERLQAAGADPAPQGQGPWCCPAWRCGTAHFRANKRPQTVPSSVLLSSQRRPLKPPWWRGAGAASASPGALEVAVQQGEETRWKINRAVSQKRRRQGAALSRSTWTGGGGTSLADEGHRSPRATGRAESKPRGKHGARRSLRAMAAPEGPGVPPPPPNFTRKITAGCFTW